MEISSEGVTIAVMRQGPRESSPEVLIDSVPFEAHQDAEHGSWPIDQLQAAIATLAERHHLSGLPLSVALGGDTCVTRSWFGENEQVDANIKELTERTHRYLALGQGEKICSYSEKAADAKNKRAWVTIANRDFVAAVARAARASGMRLIHVHHTLSQLCRAVGQAGLDSTDPVLIATKAYCRPELCISFRGQLILDYRPPRGRNLGVENGHLLDVVHTHLKRIRRYAAEQLPRNHNTLNHICVFGTDRIAKDLHETLRRDFELELVPYPVTTFGEQLVSKQAMPPTVSAIVAASIAHDGFTELMPADGNLADALRKNSEIDWKQVAWLVSPIAATLLLALCLSIATKFKQRDLASAQYQLDQLGARQLELKVLKRDFEHAQAHLDHLTSLQQHLKPSGLARLVRILGRALPHNSWIKQLEIESDSQWMLRGASFSDQTAYEYMERLNSTGLFHDVALEGIKSTRLDSGPGVEFMLRGKLNAPLVGPGSVPAANSVAINHRASHNQYPESQSPW